MMDLEPFAAAADSEDGDMQDDSSMAMVVSSVRVLEARVLYSH